MNNKNKITSLPIHFSIKDELSSNDTRFIRCTIDVLHTGVNFNGSVFTKEVVEENLDTIKNTPILGFIRTLEDGEKDFKGHEYRIEKNENGYIRRCVESAYGVIPESCNPRWFSKKLDSGEEVEMLQVDAILWSKLGESSDIMLRDIEKGQSMELAEDSIEGYEDPYTGLFHFTRFSFDGCTILGDGIEPAMQDANITVNFTFDEFMKNLKSELINKYSEFTALVNETTNQISTEQVDVGNNNEGGMEIMQNTDFSSTIMQQFSDLSTIVSNYDTMTNMWGEVYPRLYLQDIQDNEIIVVDAKDNYNYYGYPYSMDGDKPVIDFACGKRKKVRYENYEDGTAEQEGAFNFGKHIASIESAAMEKISEANAKIETAENDKFEAESNYARVKAEYDEMKPQYDAYVQADEQRKANELNDQRDAKFAEYEDILSDNTEFAALKERKGELSVEDIEKECAVLYVKANRAKNNFSKTNGASATIGIMDNNDEMEGYVNTKYGPIRKSH